MCNSCGNEFPKWAGRCSACGEWNTLTEVTSLARPSPRSSNSKSLPAGRQAQSLSPSEALSSTTSQTFTSTISELDRVLGPGFTKGGVYLIAGQPGIGKSTLLTQLAISLSNQPPLKLRGGEPDRAGVILYVCSEENPSQVATRISRLTKKDTSHIQLLNTSSVDQISHQVLNLKSLPAGRQVQSLNLIIVDSIQSVFLESNPTTSGSLTQIRDSANALIQLAKSTNIPIILVGHVTKEGNLAGPKLLEHMVDTVLELSGDRQNNLRILRSHKNRFGPTDEAGLFSMTANGLEEVTDPGKFLLEDRLPNSPGSVLTMIMEGTRPMIIEIQALVTSTPIPIPRRIAKGISTARLQLITAILTKHLHLPLADKDIFVNITGGLTVNEPGADLGIALAIAGSVKEKTLPGKTVCFGELGLLGEIRKVTFGDKREKEAKKLGYTTILSPSSYRHIREIRI